MYDVAATLHRLQNSMLQFILVWFTKQLCSF